MYGRRRNVVRRMSKALPGALRRGYNRVKPILRRVLPSYIPLPGRSNKYLTSFAGSPTKRKRDQYDSTDNSPAAGTRKKARFSPYERKRTQTTIDNGISANSTKVSRWLKYKPASKLTIDYKNLRNQPPYRRVYEASEEIKSEANKQHHKFFKCGFGSDLFETALDNPLIINQPPTVSSAGTYKTNAGQQRIVIQYHTSQYRITNPTNVPCRVRMIHFRAHDDTNVSISTMWATDLALDASNATSTTLQTTALTSIPPAYSDIGAFPHTNRAMRKFWRIKKHKTMQLGVGETVTASVKHKSGVLYFEDVMGLKNQGGTAMSEYAMKGWSDVVMFIVNGIITADTNSIGQNDSNKAGITGAQVVIKSIRTLQYKYPTLLDVAPKVQRINYSNIGVSPDTTMQVSQASNVGTQVPKFS